MIEVLVLSGVALTAGWLAGAFKKQKSSTSLSSRPGTFKYRTQDG